MATKRQTKRRRCRIFMAEKRRRRGRQERKKHCPEGTSAKPTNHGSRYKHPVFILFFASSAV